MFEVISKSQDKLGYLYGAQRERIGLEHSYKGRDLIWLVEATLGTEEEMGMKSVLGAVYVRINVLVTRKNI